MTYLNKFKLFLWFWITLTLPIEEFTVWLEISCFLIEFTSGGFVSVNIEFINRSSIPCKSQQWLSFLKLKFRWGALVVLNFIRHIINHIICFAFILLYAINLLTHIHLRWWFMSALSLYTWWCDIIIPLLCLAFSSRWSSLVVYIGNIGFFFFFIDLIKWCVLAILVNKVHFLIDGVNRIHEFLYSFI